MFLKSIEIRGFKSFADKTELTFKQGVTAVVGPNGSGKSNISDAVRWVLGEQSIRNLRGDKMEDVIFAGTQYRKPVGLAQVSLTLDNSDSDLDIAYSQVTVARRLYRSGDSEYLINNTVCRLKDVQALFMDTGIGKEGYSLIGQGKIDAILSAKSEDRRKLLEEAAGIVKYKTRKEEAERKLENTEQNLLRINDIISTYEERLPALEADCEKAKVFLEASEQIKIKEVNIIIDFLEKTKFTIDKINGDIKSVTLSQENLNGEKNQLKIALDEKNEKLEKINSAVDEKKRLYYEAQSQHQAIIGEVKLYEEKIIHLTETMDRLKNESKEKSLIIEEQMKSFESKQHNLEMLKQEEKDIDEKISLKEKEISGVAQNVTEFNEKMKALESDRFKYYNEINSKNNEAGILKNNIELCDESLEKLILDVQTFKNSILINTKTKAHLEEEKTAANDKVEKYEEQIKENRKKIIKARHELENMERQLREMVKVQGNNEARLNALVNLEHSYEGYNKSVKLLMQYIEQSKNYKINDDCFVLGDIIKVPQRVEKAIEIAMGASISNIVTKDENIAKNLINYLKSNRLGRATFMPLSIVRGKNISVDRNVLDARGYIGIASELIEFEAKFKGVVDQVLGKTLVCDTMDNGLHISKISGYKYRIVTLDGEVFNPGGSLTGGSYAKNANVIGRKREIEELTEKVAEAKEVIKRRTSSIAEKNEEIKKFDDEGLDLRDKIHFENINTTKINGEISKVEEEEQRNKRELQRASEGLAKEDQKLKVLKENLKKTEDELIRLSEEMAKINSEYEEVHEKTNGQNSYIEELREELTTIKISKAKVKEMINNNLSDLSRIENSIKQERNLILNHEEEIIKSKNSIDTLKNEIENNHSSVKDITESFKEFEKFFEDAEIDKIKIKEKLPMITSKIEDINLQLEKLEKEVHKNEIALAKIEAEEEALLKKLNEEYNLTFAEGLSYKVEDSDIVKLKGEVTALKKKISDLGTVNLGAIEEFKEVNEKYTFMNGQREDLVESKMEIESFITEMTEKMRTVFMSNFKQLREYFNETFRELFKGGSADLTLQGDDELTCKIEINVEPPGKKLQNINLLSGGEKVLSAIALLFAILKMKPTPFCILDEIEAALDDANVLRYGEFLKKFSEKVQFIVITHRKGTMETSDMIYGVTMEEKGVSKVVSLELTK